MAHALALGRRGMGNAWPNPSVGAVLVREGRIVGRGWTQPGGRPHAERTALDQAGAAARGATAYVTLEPCAHHGATPPCAEALIAAGITRVVAAIEDPDPRVSGRGLALLRAAGLEVTLGTLAHEAGHSMHTWHSSCAQLYQNHGYPIFLAEVASTFNEMLLTEHLLKTTDDPAMKAFILNRQIDDLRGTLYRQTMFAEFEREAHAAEERGDAVTLEGFKKIYRSLLTDYFGPKFSIDEELDLECLRIPHFYSAFYVYKYATGISAAAALARQVLETGDASRYLGFLKSGGSKFPVETLREAGVDMASPEPVQATLDLFARRVKELSALIG